MPDRSLFDASIPTPEEAQARYEADVAAREAFASNPDTTVSVAGLDLRCDAETATVLRRLAWALNDYCKHEQYWVDSFALLQEVIRAYYTYEADEEPILSEGGTLSETFASVLCDWEAQRRMGRHMVKPTE